MKSPCSPVSIWMVFLSFTFLMMGTSPGQTFTTLYSFTGTTDGEYPFDNGSLVVDSKGDLYGTTVYTAQEKGRGKVFRLSQAGQESVLDDFGSNNPDGKEPFGGLIADRAGNLYGTTWAGGVYGWGTVFELSPPRPGHSGWTETLLHSFEKYSDGAELNGPLIMDAAGNLYGAAVEGGHNNGGTVFRLNTQGNFVVLHNFGNGPNGEVPGGLALDPAGNVYGSTGEGGIQSCNGGSGCGVVFRLSPTGHESVLHTFTGGTDGGVPGPVLILDVPQRALYGIAAAGGEFDCGVIFKLDATGETVLYSFMCGADGNLPDALIRDAAGNLYGAAAEGGDLSCNAPDGCGVLFKLDAANNYTVLYTFSPTNGDSPACCGGLVLDGAGNLYGVTKNGGDLDCDPGGCGTVFELAGASED
jgi:uncharacterized repeat protein (TIGR03803 family)